MNDTPLPGPSQGVEPVKKAVSAPGRSKLMTIAGWLTVVAGLLALYNGITAIAGESSFVWFDIDVDFNRYVACGVIITIFGALAVLGGTSAIRGMNISLALAGAAFGMIGDGMPGFMLGLTAVILLFLSHQDF